MTAQDLLHKAQAEIGVCEFPSNSNNVKYNTWFYGKQVKGAAYPWCCAFVSWLFKENPALCKKSASCVDLLSWFEKKGQIVKTPKAGDIVFFKYSTNARRTNHVGIVESVSGRTINTIEGNTSVTSNDNGGKVMRRRRTGNIVAYARPAYSPEIKKSNEEIAHEVIAGEWGNGEERKRRLEAAGYNYETIRKIVNDLLKG
jgi:hypothetical protein